MSGLGSDHRLHVHLQDVAQAVHGIHIHRIADGYGERVVVLVNRDNLVAAGNVLGYHRHHLIGHAVLGQIDRVHSELAGQRLGHVHLGDTTHADQGIQQTNASQLGHVFGLQQVFVADEPDVLQDLYYVFVLGWHILLEIAIETLPPRPHPVKETTNATRPCQMAWKTHEPRSFRSQDLP